MTDKLFKKKIKLGYKPEKSQPVVSDKKEMYYPSMYINDTELPLDAEDFGKTFNAQIKVKITGINKRTGTKGTKINYDFDVMEISFAEDK